MKAKQFKPGQQFTVHPHFFGVKKARKLKIFKRKPTRKAGKQ